MWPSVKSESLSVSGTVLMNIGGDHPPLLHPPLLRPTLLHLPLLHLSLLHLSLLYPPLLLHPPLLCPPILLSSVLLSSVLLSSIFLSSVLLSSILLLSGVCSGTTRSSGPDDRLCCVLEHQSGDATSAPTCSPTCYLASRRARCCRLITSQSVPCRTGVRGSGCDRWRVLDGVRVRACASRFNPSFPVWEEGPRTSPSWILELIQHICRCVIIQVV